MQVVRVIHGPGDERNVLQDVTHPRDRVGNSRATGDKHTGVEARQIRWSTVWTVHEDRDIGRAIPVEDLLPQALGEAAARPYDERELALLAVHCGVLSLLGDRKRIDRLADRRDRERVALEGPDGRKREKHVLAGFPASALRERAAAGEERDVERATYSNAHRILGEEFDMCRRLVRRLERGEYEVAEVAADPVDAPDEETRPREISVPAQGVSIACLLGDNGTYG